MCHVQGIKFHAEKCMVVSYLCTTDHTLRTTQVADLHQRNTSTEFTEDETIRMNVKDKKRNKYEKKIPQPRVSTKEQKNYQHFIGLYWLASRIKHQVMTTRPLTHNAPQTSINTKDATGHLYKLHYRLDKDCPLKSKSQETMKKREKTSREERAVCSM